MIRFLNYEQKIITLVFVSFKASEKRFCSVNLAWSKNLVRLSVCTICLHNLVHMYRRLPWVTMATAQRTNECGSLTRTWRTLSFTRKPVENWLLKYKISCVENMTIDGICSPLTAGSFREPMRPAPQWAPRIVPALACAAILCFLQGCSGISIQIVMLVYTVPTELAPQPLPPITFTCILVPIVQSFFLFLSPSIATLKLLYVQTNSLQHPQIKGNIHWWSHVWLISINTMSLQLHSVCYKT